MAISAKDVMDLRKRTGAGMMECKKALTETNGDAEAAVQWLIENVGSEDRGDKVAAEGVVAQAIGEGAAAMVQLLSETDFVARNADFQASAAKVAGLALAQSTEGEVAATADMEAIVEELRRTIKENIQLGRMIRITAPKIGHYVHHNHQLGVLIGADGPIDDQLLSGLCQHITAMEPQPLAVDQDALPADVIEAQRKTAIEEAKATGKPEQIAEKIAEGKLRKWVDEHTLLGQNYLKDMDANKPVREYLPKDAKILSFVRFSLSG